MKLLLDYGISVLVFVGVLLYFGWEERQERKYEEQRRKYIDSLEGEDKEVERLIGTEHRS